MIKVEALKKNCEHMGVGFDYLGFESGVIYIYKYQFYRYLFDMNKNVIEYIYKIYI